MAHYALLDETLTVVQVFVGRDPEDLAEGVDDWETYYAPEGMTVKRTSYNTRGGVHYDPETGEPSADQSKAFRYNFAGEGHTYDPERDAFIAPSPWPSWLFDEETCTWKPPVPHPNDGLDYRWDEASGDWVEVVEPSA